ncbi:MAG: Ig-like domain-containing protein [Cellvibrio sp.]|uniref:Ig-like domain-containing protein n=1 Tax=Cellvibrio sp. TaxID=1965322 RepID=UPI0031A72608
MTTPENTPVSGRVSASDRDGDTLSFSVGGNPAHGTVTLNPATGSFVYTPGAGYNGSDSFTVTVSDGNGGTTTSVVSIGVTPVNDAPVASNLNLTTNENTPVPGSISASDPDGDTLSFSVTGAPTNGTVVLNAATGTFTYTPTTGYSGSDSFVVTISDGNGGTTTSTVTIGVNAVNNAPTAADDTATTDESLAVTIAVRANDVDPDGDTLTVTGVTQGANGSVVIDAVTGNPIYTPNAGFTGTDTFTYTIEDGRGGIDTATVTVTVNAVGPVNNAPVAVADAITVAEGGVATTLVGGATSLLTNDTDADGDPLTAVLVTGPSNGTLTLNPNGTFSYIHNGSETTTDSFTYKVNDGTVDGNTVTVTINVTPVNDAPISVADSIQVAEGGTATVLVGGATSVLANDSDAEGDLLTAVLVTGPTNGTLTLNANGTFSYVHNGSETTTDSFTYRAHDGTANGNIVTVTINVTPVNDAPVANNDTASVNEDGSVVVAVRANDTDAEGDALTVNSVTQGSNGSVVIDAVTGNPIYTPNAGFSGTDSFTYTVRDPSGAISNTATVTVTVNPVNHAPVAAAETITLLEGGVATSLDGGATSVLANDTDADGDPLTAILVSGPAHGTLTLNANGTFSYTHDGSETTVDSFTYKVNDGTVDGNTVTVNINITPVNEKPVAVDDYYTTDEDTPIVFNLSDWLVNDSDPDGDTIAVFSAGSVVNGSLSYVGGQLTFTPDAEFSGQASFKYSIHDGHGNTATATVYITVNPVNDPSVLVADVIHANEDTVASGNVLSNDSDVDDVLQVVSFVIDGNSYSAGDSVNVPGIGDLTLQASGSFTFTPDANYNGPVPQITYTTNTGYSSTLDITFDPVNDAPVANDDFMTTTQNVALEIKLSDLTANDTDVDGDTLTVFAAGAVSNGSLAYIGGKLHFIPAANYTGPASFSYSISDGHGGTATATVHVTVTAAPNAAPETNAVTATGDEDTLITITLSGSDSDGTVAGYVIKSLPADGVLYSDSLMTTQVSAGDLVAGPVYFMPNANWSGNTSFNYAARDNLGLEDSTPATASITVTPVNDPAQIGGTLSGDVKEDTPAQTTASGTLTIVDPDAGEQAFVVQTNAPGTYGSFSITAAGAWTYNIDNSKSAVQALKEGETKTESFTVASIDGTTKNVVITVTGTNDGPVAVADTAIVNQDAVLTLTPAQLLGNDTDIDGDTLSIASVQGAANGSVSIVGGNVVFTPTAGYHGPASFTYTVSDGHGGSSTATVNVDVQKANTPPVAVNDSAASGGVGNLGLVSEYFGYKENIDGPNLSSVEQIYTFINGRAADATFTAKTFDYGAASNFGNNLGYGTNFQSWLGSDVSSLSADPDTTSDAIVRMRGYVDLSAGNYNFKVTADDGYQIRIDGVVVAEVNANQTLNTKTHNPFTLATGGLHYVEILYWDQGSNARLKIDLSNDAGVTYKSLSDYATYKHTTFALAEDTSLSIPVSSLLANDTDADGDTLTVTSVQGAVNGSVSLVGGNVIFTPAANYAGPASFTYTIGDGKGGTATATVNLSVAPVNDAPVAVADTALGKVNTALSIPISTLLANDTDIEGDKLSLVSVQGAVNGTATISGNNIIFTPANNFEGIATFTYTIRDSFGATSTATVNATFGSATAPSVVVAKSLVAIAHGTGGTSVKFPIITKLVDTDGSESLSIKVSNVPTGLSFNAGVNLGGGVWQFTEADLPNLMLNLPGSYSTSATNMTVQVTSTEIYGGYTATTSIGLTLKAGYTTVDITTTESGSYTGSSASEFIQGGNGNNTINAANGNNIVYGGGGDDNISAGSGSDVLYGGAGNDIINAGSGTDRIIGGSGNDTMSGGDAGETFVDVFVWSLGDQGAMGTPAVDTINNFSTAAASGSGSGGDVLDLRDLLQGESTGPLNGAGNLADYLHFEVSGGNTIIHISHTGGFAGDAHTVGAGYTSGAETQQIVLSGVNLQSLYSGATTDQQIITQLLNNNKLITD